MTTTATGKSLAFTYDPLGDLTSKSDVGTYTYSSSGSQNPQAAVTVNGNSLSYDLDGNLTGDSPWTYAWDYRNRLINSSNGSASTTYQYDFQNNRVLQLTNSGVTFYPNKYESVASSTNSGISHATSTDYIYLGDRLIGEINQPLSNGTATGTPVTSYVHTDNLGSIDVLTDASGNVAQVLDYYPYGATRINTAPTNVSQRQFIGQFSDPSGLSYLNARYYNGTQGQFTSEDPVFLGPPSQQNLQDPQSLNSYSYSEDNPIVKEDPTGKYWDISFSGTCSCGGPELPGPSGAIGIQIDSHEVVGYIAPGIGWGYGGKPLGVSYTPGDIPDDGGTATVGTDAGPLGWSSDVQPGGNFTGPTTNYSLGLGVDVYIRKPLSVTLIGGEPPVGVSLVSTSNFSTPNYVSNQFSSYSNPGLSFQNLNTVQSRTTAVSSFNSSSGASSPQSQLWVTPNGAVVNWGGSVISAAPSSNKGK